MEIRSRRRGEVGGRVITVTLDAADDPGDHVHGLVIKGRLEALLRALGRPGDLSIYADAEDLRDALLRVGYLEKRTEHVVDALIVAGRDAGLSYGQIATALEMHRQTVVSRDKRLRKAWGKPAPADDDQEDA